MTTSAIYLRLSKDKALGTEAEGLGVERQEAAVRKALERKGWTVGPIYRDNDVSASGKAARPEYDRMLAGYAAGEFDAIASYDHDRLTRRPVELEHLIELNKQQGLLVTTASGDLDFTTPNGILFARFRVNLAADELLRRSTRQKAKFAQDREAGKNHWRGRRPFGLTLEGKEVEEEADAIRAIAESILDGGTISAGVEYLNSRGIKTTFGGKWERQPLRRTLMKPRLAGLLEHEGELLPGKWDAVLDRDTWDSVVAVLNTPGRAKIKGKKRDGQEYFLTGLLTCGECGGKCYGVPSDRKLASGKYKRGYFYRCAKTHVSKTMWRVDHLVIMNTLVAFMNIDTADVIADKEALNALRQDRAKELQRWYEWQQEAAEEGLTPKEIRPHKEKHETRMLELDRRIRDFEKVSLVRVPTAEEEEDGVLAVYQWDEMPLEKRRRMVETVWESITLVSEGKKGARWDDKNVVFAPRKL